MQFWLLKAEPDVYGLEHLAAAPEQIGRWDGIRNFQARNFIRDQIAIDDRVFIYHSGIQQPAIVGSARVVRAAYPDPTQFMPESNYFDPKATPDHPRWFSVDIQLLEKFSRPVSLRELKQHAALADMVLLKQGRLSTSPVRASEWAYITQLQAMPSP